MTHQETLDRLYENIEYLIKIRGYDKGRVETAIGVSVGYLSRSKAHNVDMPITTVIRIAEHFNVSLDALISEPYKANFLRQQIEVMKKQLEEVERGLR